MQVDTAARPGELNGRYPVLALRDAANVLIFPNLEAGNVAYKLCGAGRRRGDRPDPARHAAAGHVLQRGDEVEDIVNLAALAVVEARKAAPRPPRVPAWPRAGARLTGPGRAAVRGRRAPAPGRALRVGVEAVDARPFVGPPLTRVGNLIRIARSGGTPDPVIQGAVIGERGDPGADGIARIVVQPAKKKTSPRRQFVDQAIRADA